MSCFSLVPSAHQTHIHTHIHTHRCHDKLIQATTFNVIMVRTLAWGTANSHLANSNGEILEESWWRSAFMWTASTSWRRDLFPFPELV